jgi:hypothetical protein
MKKVRSAKTKKAFLKYLKEHPNERFYQAVRNFSPFPFILGSDGQSTIDTFYEEENFEGAK